MSIEEALNLIDQVLSRYQGTREDHINLQLALSIIRSATTPPIPPEPPKEKK